MNSGFAVYINNENKRSTVFNIGMGAAAYDHQYGPKMAPPVVDSLLQEVMVSVFNTRVKWKDAPAAVAVLNSKELNRLSPASFVPVLNTIPGIRMEERSPGSYRLSVRGSLLRSPFGIRNIKVYWNEIPLSDATGNTYFNLLDLQQVTNIEIAKGPAASSYGAGTGGAFY